MAKKPRRLIQKRLRALADILEESKTYNQAVTSNKCGTPACVAGHVVAWLMPEEFRICARIARPVYIMDQAQELLELNNEQANELFEAYPYDACWLGDDYDDSLDTGPATAEEAAAVLRRLAETGEVDWRKARPDPQC